VRILTVFIFLLLTYLLLEVGFLIANDKGIFIAPRGEKWKYTTTHMILLNLEEFCLLYSADNRGNFPEVVEIEKKLPLQTILKEQLINSNEWIYVLKYLKNGELFLYSPLSFEKRKKGIIIACSYDKGSIKNSKDKVWILLISGLGVRIIESKLPPIPGAFVEDDKLVYPANFLNMKKILYPNGDSG